ncbi:ArdC family protein [Anaerovibrio sp.]|uniref:ArdC family protein n=1 Tax=Anaerovibrio sp. TaxID=1872532 RepID=UPI00388E8F47
MAKRAYRKTAIEKSKVDKIVEQLITHMEKGELPWHKPWIPMPPPHNGLTKYKYSPFNQFLMHIKMQENNSQDPRFFTFKNLKSQGWSIRKEASACTLYQAWTKKVEKTDKDKAFDEKFGTDEDKESDYKIVYGRGFFPVYHAKDLCVYPLLLDESGNKIMVEEEIEDPFTGIKSKQLMPKRDYKADPSPIPECEIQTYNHDEIYEKAEQILAASEAIIIEEKIDRAFYRPSTDEIHVPVREHFERLEDYYGTLMHELTHWTGSSKRLKRDLSGTFGSNNYAREELVAELSSVFLSISSNVPVNLSQNAAYLQSWLKSLKEDPKFLFEVVKYAEEAHDFLQGKIMEMEYIPITQQLQEACWMVRDFSGYKDYEKPKGFDNFPDRIIGTFRQAMKKHEFNDKTIDKICKTLEEIKESALTKEPKEVDRSQLAEMREKFYLAMSRQKFSNVNPEFLEADKKQILKMAQEKSMGR